MEHKFGVNHLLISPLPAIKHNLKTTKEICIKVTNTLTAKQFIIVLNLALEIFNIYEKG